MASAICSSASPWTQTQQGQELWAEISELKAQMYLPVRHDGWCMPVIPILRSQRQEDQGFRGSLDYMAHSISDIKQKQNKTKQEFGV